METYEGPLPAEPSTGMLEINLPAGGRKRYLRSDPTRGWDDTGNPHGDPVPWADIVRDWGDHGNHWIVGADQLASNRDLRDAAKLAASGVQTAEQLLLNTDFARTAAADEASRARFLGAKKVTSPVDFASLDHFGQEEMRTLTALRELGQIRQDLDEALRDVALTMHFESGISAMRLAEAIGVSNTTVSNWIREAKAAGMA